MTKEDNDMRKLLDVILDTTQGAYLTKDYVHNRSIYDPSSRQFMSKIAASPIGSNISNSFDSKLTIYGSDNLYKPGGFLPMTPGRIGATAGTNVDANNLKNLKVTNQKNLKPPSL